MNSTNEHPSLEQRYRTMLTLWFGLFASIGMFFVITVLTSPREVNENKILTYTFYAIGLLAVIASRFIKQKYVAHAIDKQEPDLVQTGMVLAASFCELAAMMGILDHFLTGNRYYFLPMILGAIGTLLNFPRREQLMAASYKKDLS